MPTNSKEKIYGQMCKILADIKAIGKEQTVKTGPQKFNFRGVDDVYNQLHGLFAKHNVFCLPFCIELLSEEAVTSRSGTGGWRQKYLITFRFFAEDGSYVDAQSVGEAIDYGDKGSNKCMSIASKYALLQTFCIPVDDMQDPDSTTHDLKSTQNKSASKTGQEALNKASGKGKNKSLTEKYKATSELGEEDVKALFIVGAQFKWTRDQIKSVLEDGFNYPSTYCLSKEELHAFIAEIKTGKTHVQVLQAMGVRVNG